MKIRALILTFALVLAGRAEAQLVNYPADYSGSVLGADPGDSVEYAAEAFTLTSASTITSYQFAGLYLTNPATLPTDDFTVGIYTNINDPSTLVSDGAFTETRTSSGYTTNILSMTIPIENYTLTLDTPIQLSAGTYYLEISNADSPTDGYAWLQSSTSTPPYEAAYKENGALVPTVAPYDVTLGINGTVNAPEPSIWIMLSGALGVLAFLRKHHLGSR